jgi:hypothetical protein
MGVSPTGAASATTTVVATVPSGQIAQHRIGRPPPRGQADRHGAEHGRAEQQAAAVGGIGVGRGERGHDRRGARAEQSRAGEAQTPTSARAAAGLATAQGIGDGAPHPTCIGPPRPAAVA